MVEDFSGFNTNHPNYKQLRQEFNKVTKNKQDLYTDKLDAIAEKKAKRLLAED